MNIIELLFGSKLTDDQVKDLDTDNYTGVRYRLYTNGTLVGASDTRDIFFEKAIKIKQLKEVASDAILSKAPVFDQINAVAGRLTAAEKTALDAVVDNIRTKYKTARQAILDANTLAEVEAVNIGV